MKKNVSVLLTLTLTRLLLHWMSVMIVSHRSPYRLVLAWLALLAAATISCAAAGSPNAFRTLVVVNTNSVDSVELGDYYAAAHAIPAHHICRLGIDPSLVSLTSNQFHTLLLSPITNHIATNGLSDQIDFLVLSWAFPTRVRNVEGVSASLFYGFQNAPAYNEGGIGCNLPEYTSNAYFRAEQAFRSADGWNATNGFIAFHLIASNLPTAKLVVDRGAAAQSTFPASSFNLYNVGDGYRGIRHALFDNAQFSLSSLPGLLPTCYISPNFATLIGKTNLMGYQDGYSVLPGNAASTNNVWLPGAYADHLTSYGGMIANFSNATGQSTVLNWMGVGATASYGTVAEPCAFLAKFPDPLMAFWYARGFTIGEAYAMAVEAPYQGLLAGDPLAAPFAAPPPITITSPASYQIVNGTIPIQVSAVAHSNGTPAAAMDFYLDERLQTNLITLSPTAGNSLSIVVDGRTNTAVVTPAQSLFDAVSALATAVNTDPLQIVSASAASDRIELIYNDFDHDGDTLPVSASVAQGLASALTIDVGPAATNLLPSIYSARKKVKLSAHTSSGANSNDLLTCVVTLTNGIAITNALIATQNESVSALLDRLRNAINANPTLSTTNGVFYNRLSQFSIPYGTLFARTPGPDGAGIHIDFSITPVSTNSGLKTNDTFSSFMLDNTNDVRSRASILFHVKPSNDVLEAETTLDTTALPDGIHTLDIVARDGTAVAAASRLTRPIAVANTSHVLNVSSAYGVGSPLTGFHFHPPGTILTNSMTAPAPANGTQLVCAGWTMMGNEPATGSTTSFSMTLTNHAALTWLWTTNYWLNTTSGPNGSVNVADSWQPGGISTQITALPDAYYAFTNWSGDVSSTTNPLDLLIDAPTSIQANFTALLATNATPQWWLAQHGWTNDFDAAATNDADSDGFFTWQEYLADTDPTNAASYLFPLCATGSVESLVIGFDPTSTQRHYWIDATEAIVLPDWDNVTNAPGTGSAWLSDITPPATGLHFYRGRVTLPP